MINDIDLLIMGILFILAITFMLLTILRTGLLEATTTTILWFIIALYYPTFQPAVSGIAWLFYGLGIIFLIVTFKAAFNLLAGRKRSRWSLEL